jgi:hypothetical protein
MCLRELGWVGGWDGDGDGDGDLGREVIVICILFWF